MGRKIILNEKQVDFLIKKSIVENNDTDEYKKIINNVLAEINEYLADFGLSCTLNTKYDFSGYYKDCIAVYQYRSVLNNGRMRIALNLPLLLSHATLDDFTFFEIRDQIEISLWHEVGHGLIQWIKSLRRKDTQSKTNLFKGKIVKDIRYILNNEENVAEEFGEYNNGYKTHSILNDFINDYIQILKNN